MKRRLTAALLAGALALALTTGGLAASGFSDIANLQPWGREAVEYVTGQGLMNGTGATTFSPNTYADRATVATLIWRIAGKPIGNITGTFTDVPLNQWYSDAIDWAAESDVVTGANGRFRPFDVVTRQDLAVMLYPYAGSPAADVTVLSWYQDYNQILSYAANAMAWAVSEGILSGDGTSLMPQYGTKRVELAAILMRFLEKDAQEPENGADALPQTQAPSKEEESPAETEPSAGGEPAAGDPGVGMQPLP